MSEWRYEISHKDGIIDAEWESGFESCDDAYDAMSERLAELVDEIADCHPELTDQEIEDNFDWCVREE